MRFDASARDAPVSRSFDTRQPRTGWSRIWPLPFPLWFPLTVYAATRAISAVFMLAAVGPAHRSGYTDLATAWDGDWYRAIATQGYPSVMPLDIDGNVAPNRWAFSPGFPLLVRAVMAVTRLSFSVVAPSLSLVLGAAAMVVVFRLMERAVNRFCACACVILGCTFMAAPVFQLAYAESLALLLLAGSLALLRERKYLMVAVLLLLLALTRPVVLAFVPVVMAHGISRWRTRGTDPFPPKDRRVVAALGLWCIAVTGLWPVIVGVSNRDPSAWIEANRAWNPGSYIGPGLGWPNSFLTNHGWLGLATLALVVLLTLGIVLRPDAKAWGPELRTWALAYPAYFLVGTVPGPSVIRWLVLAFPLMWPFPELAATRSERQFRVALIGLLALVGLAMQWVWVSTFLGATAPSLRFP